MVVRDANSRFMALKQLKAVEIKCHVENIIVKNIAMILRSYGVLPEQISIEENFYPSDCKLFIITLHHSLFLRFASNSIYTTSITFTMQTMIHVTKKIIHAPKSIIFPSMKKPGLIVSYLTFLNNH